LKAKDATIKDRYCKEKELDAVPEVEEGGENEFKTHEDAADVLKEGMSEAVLDFADRVNTYNIQTD